MLEHLSVSGVHTGDTSWIMYNWPAISISKSIMIPFLAYINDISRYQILIEFDDAAQYMDVYFFHNQQVIQKVGQQSISLSVSLRPNRQIYPSPLINANNAINVNNAKISLAKYLDSHQIIKAM
jgi:hypothetical protein